MTTIKSDIGAKAAWKGFSSQTKYIAYRLLLLEDKYDFYPENVEDLMIKEQEKIVELVQIKNLSGNLSLSSFSPQNNDSFFRRALSKRQDNGDIVLRVVSFGPIGEELQGLIDNTPNHVTSVKRKLEGYRYTLDEVNWLISHLSITKVEENGIEGQIFSVLEARIETMAAPQIIFDILTSYISDLSRYAMSTSREEWESKLTGIVKDIAAINGMCAQYGKTIITLNDYVSNESCEELAFQYRIGINAHPQHIRDGLDIIREKWLHQIEEAFNDLGNVVIIKGASGQGKSSLAYRYLIDNYPEEYVFVIEKVTGDQQAIDIVAALNGLSAAKSGEIIVYMDVEPYDKNWVWIVEEIAKRGVKLKLLITIRQDDFNRSDIELNKIKVKIVEIFFDGVEAREIFDKYHSPYFLNFDQAWGMFGETGPFMEFMYMLNKTETLSDKLKSQIGRIIEYEEKADDWLNVLQIVSYAGQKGLKVDIQELITILQPDQIRKMLKHFEKEYFIKVSDDGKYVKPLHSVRAKILYDILKHDSTLDEQITLLCSLRVISGFFQPLLVEYFFENIDEADIVVDEIIKIKFDSWTGIASALSSILWLDAYKFYLTNKAVIQQGNESFSDNFVMFMGDITGYHNFSYHNLNNIFGLTAPEAYSRLETLMKSLPQENLDYQYTDIFINGIKPALNGKTVACTDNLSEVGFVLFWFAHRDVFLGEISCEEILQNWGNLPLDEVLDFLVGIQLQKQEKLYSVILNNILPIISEKYSIIYLDHEKEDLKAEFILDVSPENLEDINTSMNDRVMRVVFAMRRLFFHKKKYHVEVIGAKLIPSIPILDSEKNIPSHNLPLVWITQINGWVRQIDEYEKRLETWNDFKQQLDECQKDILSYVKVVCSALEYFYRKGGDTAKFNTEYSQMNKKLIKKLSTESFKSPKCVSDRYGLKIKKNRIELVESIGSSNLQHKEKDIISYSNDYVGLFINFLRQMNSLIMSRVQKKELDDVERLSLTNILSAVTNLRQLQKQYYEVFIVEKNEIRFKDEYEQLLLLANVWFHLYENEIRIVKSILYDTKIRIKQKRRELNQFFETSFIKFNAQEVAHNEIRIVHEVPINLVDEFCKCLFNGFKKDFGDVGYLSVDRLFLNEFAEELILLLSINGKEYIGGFKIKLDNLFVCQSEEKFMAYRIALNKKELEELNQGLQVNFDDPESNRVKVIANLSVLSMFYNHTTDVVNYIVSSSDKEKLNQGVFDIWRNNATKIHILIIEDMIQALNKIERKSPEEQLEKYNAGISLLEKYKSKSESIILCDEQHLDKIVVSLRDAVLYLLSLDASGKSLF